jgi:hypothetical protein
MTSKRKSKPKIELRPDGWERFRLAIGAAAKSGPKHRPSITRQSKSKQSESLSNRSRLDVNVHRQKRPKSTSKNK